MINYSVGIVNTYTQQIPDIFFDIFKEATYVITDDISICPGCGGLLKYYDSVKRITRTKNRGTKIIKIRRLRCCSCGAIHREIPETIFPYKQYEAEVILGVLEGFISPDTIGFEDYPCETTMNRWLSQKIKFLI